MDSVFQPIPTYQPQIVAPTSVGTQIALMPRIQAERPTFTSDDRQCDVREANGGDGSFTFKDCNGAQVGKLEWRRGIIQDEGDQEMESGCNGGSSGGFF